MLSGLGRGAPPHSAVVGDDAADQRPAGDQPGDIGERVPANRQRAPLKQNGIDRGKWQDERGHKPAGDATGPLSRQERGEPRPRKSPVKRAARPSGNAIPPIRRRRKRASARACAAPGARRAGARLRRSVSANRAGRRSPISRRGGAKPVDFSTASYQAGAQTPSLARRPGGQDSIASSKAMPQAAQSARQHAARDRPARPGLRPPAARWPSRSRGALEQRDLRGQADLVEGEIGLALARVGGEHRLGRADEEGVDEAVDPVAAEAGRACDGSCASDTRPPCRRGRARSERVGDRAPVGRLRGDHLLAHGMVEAGRGEIGGVERLVA